MYVQKIQKPCGKNIRVGILRRVRAVKSVFVSDHSISALGAVAVYAQVRNQVSEVVVFDVLVGQEMKLRCVWSSDGAFVCFRRIDRSVRCSHMCRHIRV